MHAHAPNPIQKLMQATCEEVYVRKHAYPGEDAIYATRPFGLSSDSNL